MARPKTLEAWEKIFSATLCLHYPTLPYFDPFPLTRPIHLAICHPYITPSYRFYECVRSLATK
jgi:hypothetical protein